MVGRHVITIFGIFVIKKIKLFTTPVHMMASMLHITIKPEKEGVESSSKERSDCWLVV